MFLKVPFFTSFYRISTFVAKKLNCAHVDTSKLKIEAMSKVLIDSQIATLMPFFNPIIDAIAEKVTKRIKDIQVERIPKYYTRQETANILHVTLPTLHNMVKRGDIIAKRVNGRVLFDAAEIDSAVKDCRIYKYKRK